MPIPAEAPAARTPPRAEPAYAAGQCATRPKFPDKSPAAPGDRIRRRSEACVINQWSKKEVI
ncbi:hypothetical protein JCM9534A_37470 [Catenuloplanes indicus JCM 9534]